MSLALIAPASFPSIDLMAALRREGEEVLAVKLEAGLSSASVPAAYEKGVLVQPEQGVVTIGEQISRVRAALGEKRALWVCCPQTTPRDLDTLMECGATKVLTPSSWAVLHVAERILSEIILAENTDTTRKGALRGGTRVMRTLYSDIATLAPLDDPILILGETGTGKELAARELHRQSCRQDVFVPINCAELSPELLGSELFGHEKGAFTNALQTRKGLLVEAQAGTVFLDEIGDLDIQAQAKLLRVIEEMKVRSIGANRWEEVHARLVLATSRNLEEDSHVGKFRLDLLERIRGFTLELPPLRQRKADIPLLAHHFVAEFSQYYRRPLNIPVGALDCLFRYDWGGNVRELRAAVRKAAAYADEEGNISTLLLQEAVRGRKKIAVQNSLIFDPSADTWRDVQKRAEAAYFRAVLAVANGNKEVAAKLAGLSRAQLYEKLKGINGKS